MLVSGQIVFQWKGSVITLMTMVAVACTGTTMGEKHNLF